MSREETRNALERVLASGSLLGARLRPLLIEDFQRATGRDPEPYLRSFGKFSAFLAHNADLVVVRPDDRSTDVRVSLRSGDRDGNSGRRRRRFSSQLWRAFTNPDEGRRRFYHRDTQEVVHFLADSSNSLDESISNRVKGDDRFVEIEYARAEEQTGWMRSFLEGSTLPESTRRVASHFVTIGYESAVNTAFESSLGPHGYEWRRYRVSRISEHIDLWAKKNTVSLDPRLLGSGVDSLGAAQDEPPRREPRSREISDDELRESLQTAIAAMDPSELRQVLVPASACARTANKGSGE